MIVVLEKGQKLTRVDFEKARKDYKTYIKITADLERVRVVLGGEYHADAEKMLLDQGSKQENIWGGGVNLETGMFEATAMVNLCPGRNNSTEILDPRVRGVFLRIAKSVLKNYVKQTRA